MDILARIIEVAHRRRLPIASVTVRWRSDIHVPMLSIEFNGGAALGTVEQADGITAMLIERPEATPISLPRATWAECQTAALSAAWRLGAWDFVRWHKADGIEWTFFPSHHGVGRRNQDTTLMSNGERIGPAPPCLLRDPEWSGRPKQAIQRLGDDEPQAPERRNHPNRARGGTKGVRTNRYDGRCAKCAAEVPAGDGLVRRKSVGGWEVIHRHCKR